MGFQFVRIELFSRKGRAGRSTTFILDEVSRVPSASLHVNEPGVPVVVYGLDLSALRELHDARAAAAHTTTKDGKSRAVRSDQNTLAGIILSHPATMEQYRTNGDVRRQVQDWQTRSIRWLQAQYGDRLTTVVRHEDESHPHLHAYILPNDAAMTAGKLHPGYAAKAAIKGVGARSGEDDKALNRRADAAYKAEMRRWLDNYHTTVAQPCGLTRRGPGRRHLTRAEWHAERIQARALAETLERAKAIKARGEAFIEETRSTAAMIVAHADAARADAGRQALAAHAATVVARAERDNAIAEQRKAGSMMARVREEANRVHEATSRLHHLPGILRSIWDGFRRSRIRAAIRKEFESQIEDLRGEVASAAARASAALEDRRRAVERTKNLGDTLTETTRDVIRLRRELAALQPDEPESAHASTFRRV